MISFVAGHPRFSASLVIKGCLVISVAVSAFGLWAQQDDASRPHLSHQSQPIPQNAISNEASDTAPGAREDYSPAAGLGTPIGKGLVLPSIGHVWALDSFDGVQQLVQMKYVPTNLDRHTGSILLKTQAAPFIYKPKLTIEISGDAASVRLHDSSPVIYLRGYGSFNEDGEDAADPSATSATQTQLMVVKLESKKDKRVISTIAFTQLTGHAARNSQMIPIKVQRVAHTDWESLTVEQPLEPGEYALVPMPAGQNLFPSAVFDFAVDPKAPANASAMGQ